MVEDFGTARVVLTLLAVLCWLAVVVGLVGVAGALWAGDVAALMAGLASALGGVIGVCLTHVGRATIVTAEQIQRLVQQGSGIAALAGPSAAADLSQAVGPNAAARAPRGQLFDTYGGQRIYEIGGGRYEVAGRTFGGLGEARAHIDREKR